jgi:hypothetical protein
VNTIQVLGSGCKTNVCKKSQRNLRRGSLKASDIYLDFGYNNLPTLVLPSKQIRKVQKKLINHTIYPYPLKSVLLLYFFFIFIKLDFFHNFLNPLRNSISLLLDYLCMEVGRQLTAVK